MTSMTRDEIQAFFEESEKVEKAIGKMLYVDAVPTLAALTEMRNLVGEQLPGGYYGKCIGCEEVKGEDEMQSCGDEMMCLSCIEQWNKEAAHRRISR
jgi:hypothetical protein